MDSNADKSNLPLLGVIGSTLGVSAYLFSHAAELRAVPGGAWIALAAFLPFSTVRAHLKLPGKNRSRRNWVEKLVRLLIGSSATHAEDDYRSAVAFVYISLYIVSASLLFVGLGGGEPPAPPPQPP